MGLGALWALAHKALQRRREVLEWTGLFYNATLRGGGFTLGHELLELLKLRD